jgi:hypothetical protein
MITGVGLLIRVAPMATKTSLIDACGECGDAMRRKTDLDISDSNS